VASCSSRPGSLSLPSRMPSFLALVPAASSFLLPVPTSHPMLVRRTLCCPAHLCRGHESLYSLSSRLIARRSSFPLIRHGMTRSIMKKVCASQVIEDTNKDINQVNVLHPDAGAYGSLATITWRKAWRALWIQSVLCFLACMFLSFSYVIQWNIKLRTLVSQSELLLGIVSSGLAFSFLSIVLLLVQMLWTWGYTRAAVKLSFVSGEMQLSASRKEEERKSETSPFELCRNLRHSLEIGTGLGLVGIFLSSAGIMKIVGSVAFFMIRQRGFNVLFWANNPPVMLQARDVFLSNCNIVLLVAHTAGLLCMHSLKRKLP